MENCIDAALLNGQRWASVAVDSAAAHAGPAGPLPAALSARDAIDDLPATVLPGARSLLSFFEYFLTGGPAAACGARYGARNSVQNQNQN